MTTEEQYEASTLSDYHGRKVHLVGQTAPPGTPPRLIPPSSVRMTTQEEEAREMQERRRTMAKDEGS